jgi:hypothetical protein
MEIVIITVAAFALIGFIVGKIIDHCCKHEWETDEKVRVCDHSEIWGDSKYDRYYLRCKKCGKVKIKNMK